jgi:hypothetical protein
MQKMIGGTKDKSGTATTCGGLLLCNQTVRAVTQPDASAAVYISGKHFNETATLLRTS